MARDKIQLLAHTWMTSQLEGLTPGENPLPMIVWDKDVSRGNYSELDWWDRHKMTIINNIQRFSSRISRLKEIGQCVHLNILVHWAKIKNFEVKAGEEQGPTSLAAFK